MKKHVIPEIAPEDMTPELAGLVAFTRGLADENKALHAQKFALEKELALLKKAKKPGFAK